MRIKRIFVLWMILGIFFLSGTVAQQESLGIFKAGTNITLIQLCGTCTYNNISSITDPQSNAIVTNQVMTKSGVQFSYNLSDALTNRSYGRYNVNGYGDKDGTQTPFAYYFYLTASGTEVNGTKISAYGVLFAFLLLLIFVFYFITIRVNYEKWYASIIKKYEQKNTVKVVISAIGYNILKNRFIWFYLFGLPIILLITDITYTFGVDSMIELMKILLTLYWIGLVIVGIFFFGFLQEWIVNLVNEFKSIDYGV